MTDRKMAEEALASLSGRLIEAQEEERKRIARELHDDFNQRLAMIAIDLDDLAENPSVQNTGQRLHELFNRINEVGEDMHSLSHSLHSSTLEALGLVPGLQALCREFSEQQEIAIDFTHRSVVPRIPAEIALCLFRVVQEALRNVKRHSGADRAEVRLEGLPGRIQLSISDKGNWHRPEQARIRTRDWVAEHGRAVAAFGGTSRDPFATHGGNHNRRIASLRSGNRAVSGINSRPQS